MANYVDSIYTFTDPIRYFKENDPYYWEVDNIPLKQLQENVLWLKDQLNLIPEEEELNTGVNRSDLNELKPYVNSTGTQVLVNAGRFIARINDAYNKSPLQKLQAVVGESYEFTEFNTEYYFDNTKPDYSAVFLQRLRSSVASSAMELNGLIERIGTWDQNYYDIDSSALIIQNGNPIYNWPTEDTAFSLKQFFSNVTRNNRDLGNEFIKQFRGVARTAVVDVPTSLSIEIPAFDERDYFYQTQNGTTELIPGATVRVDLLFVYSKPVDVSSTTINKWNNNQPTTILQPQLGLIKGAGVGVRDVGAGNVTEYLNPKDINGNTQILANVLDQSTTTNGFQGLNVHGSFPSPDDLLNLAPLIQEKFESNDPRLIGQSILPLAYIVVRKDAQLGPGGVPILTQADIIDIRPFLRTAELSYNERAGICAATPSLSLANPVATKYNIEKTISSFKDYADDTYATKQIVATTNSKQIAAAGYVLGGSDHGPEQIIFGAGSNLPIGWDKSMRVQSEAGPAYGLFEHVDLGATLPYGNYRFIGGNHGQQGQLLIWRKQITVTGIESSFQDYTVNTNWHNCFPITGDGVHAIRDGNDVQFVDSKHTGLYVLKGPIDGNTLTFTIVCIASLAYSGWLSMDMGSLVNYANQTRVLELFHAKNMRLPISPTKFAADGKISEPFESCFHPSVKWEVFLTQQPLYGGTTEGYGSGGVFTNTGNTQVKSYI